MSRKLQGGFLEIIYTIEKGIMRKTFTKYIEKYSFNCPIIATNMWLLH